MPDLTNPMIGLNDFKRAHKAGEIDLIQADVDPSIWVHVDQPNGFPRCTYAKIVNDEVIGVVMIVMAEPIAGVACYAIGWAVTEEERRKGIATRLAADAITEFRDGVGRHGINDLWVEAVIGVDNTASQKVAAAVLGGEGRPGTDDISGHAIVVYARMYA